MYLEIIGAIGIAVWFVYIALTWAEAKRSVDVARRVNVFMCDVHGPIAEGSTFTLFDDLEVQYDNGEVKREPMRVCPICFENKIKLARSKT
jgi:hypothetical protein